MKASKIKNSIQHRLPIWQSMMSRPDGVSIEEIQENCTKFIDDSDDPKGILRRDLTTIRSLIDKVESLCLQDETGKRLDNKATGRS